ncbi:MAG: hypothetical protein KME22_21900 [Hassallia sp. WJT32-NPBG1]|nr:hypothetical protein [Hassallia sp. WJT32-NPBG1]
MSKSAIFTKDGDFFHPTALDGRNRRPESWARAKGKAHENQCPIPNPRSHPPESRTGDELKDYYPRYAFLGEGYCHCPTFRTRVSTWRLL